MIFIVSLSQDFNGSKLSYCCKRCGQRNSSQSSVIYDALSFSKPVGLVFVGVDSVDDFPSRYKSILFRVLFMFPSKINVIDKVSTSDDGFCYRTKLETILKFRSVP